MNDICILVRWHKSLVEKRARTLLRPFQEIGMNQAPSVINMPLLCFYYTSFPWFVESASSMRNGDTIAFYDSFL